MRFKKKKTRSYRGSTYHGWGRGAAHHKGAGNRGGKGRAGSGKKADQKKPSYWHEEKGKKGFTSKNRMTMVALNIDELVQKIERFVADGSAAHKDSGYQVDLLKAGYNKLLGKGRVNKKLFITTDFASVSAIEKIKAAGGSVTVLKKIEKKEKKKAEKPANKAKPEGKSAKPAKSDDEE
ncbi:MAG: uL15m family ribosomal protein [archaeon]